MKNKCQLYVLRFSLSLILSSLFCFNNLVSQEDWKWIIGVNDETNQIVTSSTSGFQLKNSITSVPIESAASLVLDSLHEVSVFTNGCYLFDEQGNKISNEKITDGLWSEEYCDQYGLLCPRGVVIMEQPEVPAFYFVLTQGLFGYIDSRIDTRNIYLSTFSINDQNINIDKIGEILIEGDVESFDIVRHGNGRDWWIAYINPTKKTIGSILFSKDGMIAFPEQNISYFDIDQCPFRRMIRFSPKGESLAMIDGGCGVKFYDFDRCSGLVSSNARTLKIPNNLPGRDGVFSASGDNLILSSWKNILRVRIKDVGVKSNPIDSFNLPRGVTLHRLELIQDEIIGTLHRSEPYYLLLGNGDEDTLGVNIYQPSTLIENMRTLPLAYNNQIKAVEGSICDTLFTSTSSILSPIKKIYPNPYSSEIHIIIDKQKVGSTATFYNSNSTKIRTVNLNNIENTYDLSEFTPGSYFIKISDGSFIEFHKLIRL